MRGLLDAYGEIFRESRPQWAQKRLDGAGLIAPTIPFVGKAYERSGVLLYASAENLSHYSGYLEAGDVAIANRHRYYFEQEANRTRFFPFVHCTPIQNGSLTTAAAYLCDRLRIPVTLQTPGAFLEEIAFANFGKFSIGMEAASQRNLDYASQMAYLRESFAYVEADLRVLLPETIIIPKSIYDHDAVRALFARVVPNARCVPIYQINVGNINRIIARRYEMRRGDQLPRTLDAWCENIAWSGKSKNHYRSVFGYLDDCISAAMR